MLTIFTVPKAFNGHIDIIQRNAIRSWTLLEPRCQVILAGDDEGTDIAARDLGVEHIPDVARNDFGTPLLDSAFRQVEDSANFPFICYVNADIILMDDFIRAVIRAQERSQWFMMTAQRWDLDVTSPLDFDQEWQDRMMKAVSDRGSLAQMTGIDFWVYPKGMLYDIPPLAVGRMAFECWCLYKARKMQADLIDSTKAVVSIHQLHDHSHHPEGSKGIGSSVEAQRNREMVGGRPYFFIIKDRTHVLTASRFYKPKDGWWAWRSLRTSAVLHPDMPFPIKIGSKGINGTIDRALAILINGRNLIRRLRSRRTK